MIHAIIIPSKEGAKIIASIAITSIFTLSKTPLPLPSRPTQINKRSMPSKIIKQAGIHLIIVFFALKQSRSCIEKKITARINPTIGAVLGSLKIIILRLTEVIDQLDPDDRHFIYLRYTLEMGYREIGELLNISEDAAKKRGQRLVKKLRKLYERR